MNRSSGQFFIIRAVPYRYSSLSWYHEDLNFNEILILLWTKQTLNCSTLHWRKYGEDRVGQQSLLESDLVLILFLLSFYYKAPPVSRKKWAENWLRNRMIFWLVPPVWTSQNWLVFSAAEKFHFLPLCWHNLWYDNHF